MYTRSEFNPRIISEEQNVRFLDPNPLGEIVPHEDLFIYVSLKAKTKSKTLLEQNANDKINLSEMISNGVDLITPSRTVEVVSGKGLFKPKLELTTDWTEIGAFKSPNNKIHKDFEGFGITNVDIEIKSQTSPKVTIDFIDVRGATLFEQGSCSPYGLFFNMPYPVFELTVKGYYGKAVSYYLNLVKFNSKFNSETGNMECRAEFIGYSFAFLSDTIVSYVQASQNLKESDYKPQQILEQKYKETTDFYNRGSEEPVVTTAWCGNPRAKGTGTADGNPKCTTILDLLDSLKLFDTVDKPEIISSPEYKQLQELILLEADYLTYRVNVQDLINKLNDVGELEITKSTSPGRNNGSQLRYVDRSTGPSITGSTANYGSAEVKLSVNGGILHTYFNKESGTLLGNIRLIMSRKLPTANGDIYANNLDPKLFCLLDPQSSASQFSTDAETLPHKLYDGLTADGTPLNDLPWQVGMLDVRLGYQNVKDRATLNVDVGYFIDLGYILDDIDRELDLLNGPKGILTKMRREVLDAINNLVADKIGFNPTIRNIFTVLLCNTDAFMEILKNVAIKAEEYHDNEIKNKTLDVESGTNTNEGILSGKHKIYPWPTYMRSTYNAKKGNGGSQGTKEVYPGYKYPSWPECRFVEDFIKAFLKFKDDVDNLNGNTDGKPGFDNYIPINPLESRLWYDETPIKYKDVIGASDDMYTVIGERMFITLDHSYFNPVRLQDDSLTIPKIGVGIWNPIIGGGTGNLVEKSGQIDAWNLLNTLDNTSQVQGLLTEPVSEFIAKIKTSLSAAATKGGGNYQEGVVASTITNLTPAGSNPLPTDNNGTKVTSNFGFTPTDKYYVFKTTKDGIVLKKSNQGDVLINDNASTMGVSNLIKIIPESEIGTYKSINLTTDDFKTVRTKWSGELTQSISDINFKNSEFTKEPKDLVVINETQNLISFDKPQLYSTLAMTFGAGYGGDDFAFNNWWDGDFNSSGGVGGNIVSNMGMITFWDNRGVSENTTINTINFLYTGGATNQGNQDIYTTDFFTEYYDTGTGRWKEIKVEANVTAGSDQSVIPSGQADTLTEGGMITPLVTTPMWLDNVNTFRLLTNGPQLDPLIQNRNLAYLFLHSLKMSPLVSRLITDDGYLYSKGKQKVEQGGPSSIWSLKAFNTVGGIAKVPKAWLLTLGAQLWRWREFVGVDTNGKWVTPLNGETPKGNDPLVQPGYNSIDNDTKGRNNNGKTIEFRENIKPYLKSIYGSGGYNANIPQSVFGSNYQSRQPSISFPNKIGKQDGDGYYYSFRYYNIYKDRVGLIGGKDSGGGYLLDVTASDEVNNYSWPQTYIAPHHIPYIVSEVFNDPNNGGGSDFVFLTNSFIGKQDYQTIMPQTTGGNNYNEEDGNNNEGLTHRSKFEDGNLGGIIQYLPDSVKNEIVRYFEEWTVVGGDFEKLLPTIDPINFPLNTREKLTSTYGYQKGKDSPSAVLGGDGSLANRDQQSSLCLKTESNDLKDLLTSSYYILNSTPKIWYGINSPQKPNGFVVSETDFDKYLTSFHTTFKANKQKRIEELDKEKNVQKDAGLSGTVLDDEDTKLGLYRTFKSLNDKWISASEKGNLFFNLTHNAYGNTCGQGVNGASGGVKSTLASHFQYVNRVMGDIGDLAVIDITRLNELRDNLKISLYQYLTDLLVENEYLFFPLPAYVNLTGSGVVAGDLEDMFRPSLLDIKDISCGPLFLSMYVGGASRQLKYKPSANCPIDLKTLENIADDGFSFSDINRPDEIANPKSVGSDGYTAFKVLYGIENQNHFKNIQLDQSEFSETAESLLVIDKLSQQDGNDQSTKGQNLNSVYLTRSYSCTIESLGNMMIQPMTYFDLAGVPMFSGAYLITEVKHNFKPNNSSTTFKGVRQPRATVPIVTDAAIAMNLNFKGTKAGSGKSINSISGAGGGGGSSSGLQLAGIASVPITYNGIPAQQASPLLTTNPVKPFKTSSGNPEWITLHWAAGYTYTSEYNSLKADGLAYHLSAGEDGVLYQLHSLDNVAYHAGCFRGSPSVEVPGPCKSMNSQSIGISYIGGVEDGTTHGYQRTWAEWQTEDLNYDKLGKCVGGGKFESQCKKTTYKSKKQWEAIINAILIAKAHHPTIKGITSHHLVMYDKSDVGDNFPWVELFKEIKKRSGWEPIFGDRWYDDSGNSAGLLVKEFGKSSVSAAVVASTDVQALTEYTTSRGLGNPNFNMQEIYTYLNSKISNKNLVLGIMGNMQEESGVGINNNAAGDGPKANGVGLPNGNGKYYCSWGYTQLNVCGGGGIGFLKANGLENASETEKLSALTNPSKHLDYVIDWTKTNFGNGSLPVTTTDTPENWAKKFGKEYERCTGCQDDSNGQLTKRANNATKLAGMTWS